MAFIVFADGVTTVSVRHVEAKANGSFQYRRRIPLDMQPHYGGKPFFVRSLKRNTAQLADRSRQITARLDAEWAALRTGRQTVASADQGWAAGDPLPMVFRVLTGQEPRTVIPGQLRSAVSLSDALNIYLQQHSKGGDRRFAGHAKRIAGTLANRAGELPLELYSRAHAEEFRDFLAARHSTGTVRRYLNTLVAIINKAKREKQLPISNVFEGLGIPNETKDAKKRVSFDHEELATIAQACVRLDDDIRHIVGLQLDTGARCAEVVGLRVDDLMLDGPYPFVRLRPFGTVRTLKTPASERDVPLVGMALWAATKALQARRMSQDGHGWLFPRYASDKEIKATHASNTFNKWLRSLQGVSDEKTTHCFRHAMRDRLRAAEVPHDIQELIGGWGQRTIGQGYGCGYPIGVLAQHMNKLRSPLA